MARGSPAASTRSASAGGVFDKYELAESVLRGRMSGFKGVVDIAPLRVYGVPTSKTATERQANDRLPVQIVRRRCTCLQA
jgi:hypothetical protein